MKKRTINLVLIFILLFIFVLILEFFLLYIFTHPSQEKGVNNKSHELNFEVYIINNLTTSEKVYAYFEESNKIWNQYNISTRIKSIKNVNLNLSEEEKSFLFNYLAYEENDSECDTKYMPIIDNITNKSNNLRGIFVDRGSSDNAGRGCVCNCSFVLVDVDKLLSLMDFTGLNLAHETGHLLGLLDIYGKQNLMNHHLLMKSLKSHFLNQEQVNIVQNRLNDMLEEGLLLKISNISFYNGFNQ